MSEQNKSRQLIDELHKLGIVEGDTLMLRADLSMIGKIRREAFVEVLLDTVGKDGTIMSLAFTSGVPPWKLKTAEVFTSKTPSYAGALPNSLLSHVKACRSTHPQTSFVAIGKHARFLTENHGPMDGAYEPVRRLISLKGKMALLGCVASSPGFTTTHLAEIDLNMQWRTLPPWLFSQSIYLDTMGTPQVFRRKDGGFCSDSYWRLYAEYVRRGVLSAGFIGNAYSILAPAAQCYEIEKEILQRNPKFNICESPDCFTCNVQRLDRIHHAPYYLLRKLIKSRTKPSKDTGKQ